MIYPTIIRHPDNIPNLKKAARTMVTAGVKLEDAIKQLSLFYVEAAMEQCGQNQSKAARKVGVHRNTFHRWTNETGQKKQCQSTKLPNQSLINFGS